MKKILPLIWMLVAVVGATAGAARAEDVTSVDQWNEAIEGQLFDYYQSPETHQGMKPVSVEGVITGWGSAARAVATENGAADSFPFAVGRAEARMQQGLVLEMARAVKEGRVADAQGLRAELMLPRGVSATEGERVLLNLQGNKRGEAAKLLVREAITWESTRVRQLFDAAVDSTKHGEPMPGRLMQRLGEALTLADLPGALREEAGIDSAKNDLAGGNGALLSAIAGSDWKKVGDPLSRLRDATEAELPSLLTAEEKARRERLLLKLVDVIPKEYMSGVRDGQVTVPLEYHEAVNFSQLAQQTAAELAPLWLAGNDPKMGDTVRALDELLKKADQQIEAKASSDDLAGTLASAAKILENDFGITLHLSGTTADIVDEVMVQVKSSLSASLTAAVNGQWADAERLRVEAYTTYDPDLESRLMPRDPELALNIERLLLDGVNEPGVKVMLDRHESSEKLQESYGRVFAAFDQATAILKSDVSPGAAVLSASSIVIREGLEGLLVIIAILAGLRGRENKRRRRVFWLGVLGSLVVTLITWVLSQTLLTSLRSHGEVIEAVTGLLAIGVLLLITNWLFHQVYWRQWVTTLKAQVVEHDNWMSLFTAGFLVGYREGFETVLFLQGLVMDAGGRAVAIGVLVGAVVLVGIGVAALKLGFKLPYFHILLGTAALIGLVLVTFVGGTVRAAQTIGWLPVHRMTPGSWPMWLGTWLGIHNTWESVGIQVLTMVAVLGTWRVARWQVKRKAAKREEARVVSGGARRSSLPQVAVVAEHACGNEEHEPAGCGGLGCAISCPGPMTGDGAVEQDGVLKEEVCAEHEEQVEVVIKEPAGREVSRSS